MSNHEDAIEELRRAAHAGAQLHDARCRFRRHAESAMHGFILAETELAKSGVDPILEAMTATDIAFASYIAGIENDWDEEEDFEYATPPTKKIHADAIRNRLDDFRDGRLNCPDRPDFVECALVRVAETLTLSDPQAARRMNRLAMSWSADRSILEKQPGWARHHGIIPGSEIAPSLAALFYRFGLREELHDHRRAGALRIGALAYRQLHAAASAYAAACCAEFSYTLAVGEVDTQPQTPST